MPTHKALPLLRSNLTICALLFLASLASATAGAAQENNPEKYYFEVAPKKRALVIGNRAYTSLAPI